MIARRVVHTYGQVSYPLQKGETVAAVPTEETFKMLVEYRPTGYTMAISTSTIEGGISFSASELTVAPPVGGCFTGAMYGVYSFGNGEPVLGPADFTEMKTWQTT